MGLFDVFSSWVKCPACGGTGAKKGLLGGVRCPNRSCNNFDTNLMHEVEQPGYNRHAGQEGKAFHINPRTGEPVYKDPPQGEFNPGDYAMEIRYDNQQGEYKVFISDQRSVRGFNKHVSAQVVPTGTRITLRRDRIQNLDEIEAAIDQNPQGKERRILKHHLRKGSTSELFEQLRAKYPNWDPN